MHLGNCQQGSSVAFEQRGMDLRNILWWVGADRARARVGTPARRAAWVGRLPSQIFAHAKPPSLLSTAAADLPPQV